MPPEPSTFVTSWVCWTATIHRRVQCTSPKCNPQPHRARFACNPAHELRSVGNLDFFEKKGFYTHVLPHAGYLISSVTPSTILLVYLCAYLYYAWSSNWKRVIIIIIIIIIVYMLSLIKHESELFPGTGWLIGTVPSPTGCRVFDMRCRNACVCVCVCV